MSVKVPRGSLTPELVEKIRQYLLLQPQEPPQYNQYTKSFMATTTKPPLTFYTLDEKYIYLPYKVGSALLQKPVNQDRGIELVEADIKFTGRLFEHQLQPLETAYEQLKTHGTTSLCLATGWGKTVGGASLVCSLKLHCLILHPNTVLNASWKETFSSHTSATSWIVGDEKQPAKQPHVIICFADRFDKIPAEWRSNIGTLVCDEIDALCTASRVSPLLGTQPKYIILETATFHRQDGMESMAVAMAGTHCVEKISTKPFLVQKVNTGYVPKVEKTSRGTDWNKLLDDLTTCKKRNEYIISIVRENPTKKILILAARKNHISLLQEMLIEAKETSIDTMYGTKKKYNDARILLGTCSKIGRGFDQKAVAQNYDGVRLDLLILCTSIKSLVALEQNVGRVLRADSPTVYHLIDNNPTIKRHWTKNKKWYVSRNATIKEITPNISYSSPIILQQ